MDKIRVSNLMEPSKSLHLGVARLEERSRACVVADSTTPEATLTERGVTVVAQGVDEQGLETETTYEYATLLAKAARGD